MACYPELKAFLFVIAELWRDYVGYNIDLEPVIPWPDVVTHDNYDIRLSFRW